MLFPRGKHLAAGSLDRADGRLAASPRLLEIVIDAMATRATGADVPLSVSLGPMVRLSAAC
jgi:hypothetical protein